MNIQITDQTLIDNLKRSTFETLEFGSKLYGLDSDNSDTDQVCVYAKPYHIQQSFLWEHHTLQVATSECDTVYTTLQEFVRNLLTGDSLYNFEAIHSEAARNSRLSYLYDIRKQFYNFTVVRAYLGFARRDLKHSLKDGKRMAHAIRCYHAAEMIFKFNHYTNDYREYDREVYDLMYALKNGTYDGDMKTLLNDYKDKVDTLRHVVRKAFDDDNQIMHRYMHADQLKDLDAWVIRTTRSMWYGDYEKNFTINLFYDVLENGIEYQ